VRRLAGALAAGLLTAGLTGVATTVPAWAESDTVRIEITSVTPSIVTGEGTVTITGTVTNLSADPIPQASVTMWTGNTPLTTQEKLMAALATPPAGASVRAEATSSASLTGADTALGPGVTAPFTVTAPTMGRSSLNLSQPGAAYLVGVRAYSTGTTPLGRAITVLSYPSSTGGPTWIQLITLSFRPSLITPATSDQPALFANDDLSAALAGPLSDRLHLALRPGTTVLVDPLLWDEVTAMAAGYDVRGSDGTVAPGAGQEAAQAWLDAAQPLLESPGAYRTLYGNPDVAKATVALRPDVVPWSQAALAADSPLASLPLAVLPWGGSCTPALLATVSPASPSLVVCANATGPTISTSGGLSVLAVTALPITAPTLGSSTLAQQTLTDATILLRSQAGRPIALLLDDPAAVPTTTLPTTLVPARQMAAGSVATSFGPAVDPPPASPDLVAETAGIEADVALAGQLTATSPQAGALIARALSGLWSSGWGDTPEGQQAALSWADSLVGATRAQVAGGALELRTAETWYLTAPNADVPVTVINHYNLTVSVAVQFHSDNPQRLGIASTSLIAVGPGQSVQVRVTPIASANGVTPVTATIVDSTGQPVSAPVAIQVRVTSAGRLGWIIIIASGLAFLVATALRVRQVRRTRRALRVAEDGNTTSSHVVADPAGERSTTGETDPSTPAR